MIDMLFTLYGDFYVLDEKWVKLMSFLQVNGKIKSLRIKLGVYLIILFTGTLMYFITNR